MAAALVADIRDFEMLAIDMPLIGIIDIIDIIDAGYINVFRLFIADGPAIAADVRPRFP